MSNLLDFPTMPTITTTTTTTTDPNAGGDSGGGGVGVQENNQPPPMPTSAPPTAPIVVDDAATAFSAFTTASTPTPTPAVTAESDSAFFSTFSAPTTIPEAAASSAVESFHNTNKQNLIEYYKKHNPTKLDVIDETLEKFKGREEILCLKLESKYLEKIDLKNTRATATTGTGGGDTVTGTSNKDAADIEKADKKFLDGLSPEFIEQQEKLMKRIKEGNTTQGQRAMSPQPPRGRTRRGGKMQRRRSKSLPIRHGVYT